jgi:hypothetical protein
MLGAMYSARFFGWGQWCTEAVDLWVGHNTSWSRHDGDVLDFMVGLLMHVSVGSTECYIQHSGIVKYMTGKYQVYKYVGRKGQACNVTVSAARSRTLPN